VPRPADVAAAEPAPDAPPVELVGTLVTDQGRAALLQPQGEPAVWRRKGEKIAGWELRRIEPDQVTLRNGDEVETLSLRADQVTPLKPARSAGKRKRREREEPPPEAEAAAQSTSR